MELKDRKRINNKLPGYVGGEEWPQKKYWEPAKYRTAFGLFSVPNAGEFATLNPSDYKMNLPEPKGVTIYPSLNAGSAFAGISPYVGLGLSQTQGLFKSIGDITKSSDEYLADATRSNGSIGGMNYDRLNFDASAATSDYDKSTIGDFASGNILGGFAKLFGRSSAKRKIAEAKRKAGLYNEYNESSAQSKVLQLNYRQEYGNDEDLILFAKGGKDSVETSSGKMNMEANSYTEGQESMYNKQDGTGHVIPGMPNGDTHPTFTKPSDVIFTNIGGISDLAKPYIKILESINNNKYDKYRGNIGKDTDNAMKQYAMSNLNKLEDIQKSLREIGALPQTNNITAKSGKESKPGFKNGLGSNWWIDGLGIATGLGLTLYGALSRIKKPYSFVANPYENRALSTLAGLRVNPYPIMQELRNNERRNAYNISRAGGVSGAQRAYMTVANGLGTAEQISKVLPTIQQQNNQYLANYANAALNEGNATASRLQQSYQHDLDYYSKAHAAKQQIIEQGIANALASAQQGYANAFKKRMFDNTHRLYHQEIDDDVYKYLRSK